MVGWVVSGLFFSFLVLGFPLVILCLSVLIGVSGLSWFSSDLVLDKVNRTGSKGWLRGGFWSREVFSGWFSPGAAF